MAQTTLLSSITRSASYPIDVQGIEAPSNCGTLQLILGSDWTLQMIHELPAINISIYTSDGAKYLDFDIDMSTVNSEYRNKERSLEPIDPYSIAIYNIPESFSFRVTPLFDKYALEAHNDMIDAGEIQIFDTTNKGIVDSNDDNYDSQKWLTPTDTFDLTIVFDNSNVSSSGGGGGGGGSTPTAANVTYDGSTSGLTATNVQDAIDELDQTIEELPEPMVFKGSLGTGGTVTTLPTASEANKGFTYKVITAGTYAGQTAKIGDTFISDGTAWVLIPSGDEPSGTVTNVAVTSTDGSATITGSPITSSGTIDVSVVIDDALSTTSVHPVQNKVITNSMVGEKTTGKQFVIDGQTVTAADGAERFNVYTGNSQTKATGLYSHAEGAATIATGQAAHAEGGGTSAIGDYSHAEGGGTIAHFNYSHAEGEGTRAESTHQHVQGKYNVADANNTYAFIIGNGTADNARHNAFAIDWNGNIYVNGSATSINVETLSSILNPISESAYEALTTKDKPLYFIYD